MSSPSVPAEIEVRRVAPADWPALKALRLEALADTPIAYCERLADAVVAPDVLWQQRATRGAEGGDCFQVIGWVDARPVGTAVGFGKDTDAVLAAVYVAPDCRGQGLLDRMVEQVAAWAAGQGAGLLRLLVHESNDRAGAAYSRLGFRPTGHREPYPLDLATEEVELVRLLS